MPIRRKKYHGVYYHSSPPKIFSMMKARGKDNGMSKEAIVIKPSNIRIWIHDKDIGKLSQVLWEGQGNRLRTEICSNNRVKRFLEAVPYVMNVIKETHTAVVENNISELVNLSAPPVPKALLASKDSNGLTTLHKAAGLNHLAIVEHILRMNPFIVTEMDATGKTPLHWASSLEIYNKLVQAGADELACDYRMKTANYYRNRSNELNKSLLTVIPESPRVPQSGLPSNYNWAMFDGEVNYTTRTNHLIRKSHSTYESFIPLSMSDERAHGSTEAISNTYSMNYDDLDDRIEGEENEPQNGNEQDENEIKIDDCGVPETMNKNDDQNEETIEQTGELNDNNEIEQTEIKLENGDDSDKAEMNKNAEETIDHDGEIENGQSITNDAVEQKIEENAPPSDELADTTGQEESRPASTIMHTDEHPSPRIDECTNSAENRDILIIDHGEPNPEEETELIEMDPEIAEPDVMEANDEPGEIEPSGEKPSDAETNENGNGEEDTVTLIETSNVEFINEVELINEMSESDNIDELPRDLSDKISLRGSGKSVRSGSARSERSIKSSNSRKSIDVKNESRPTSAKTLTRPNSSQSVMRPGSVSRSASARTEKPPNSSQSVRSRVQSIKSRTPSATSNRTLTSAQSIKSDKSTNEDTSNNEVDENHNDEEEQEAESQQGTSHDEIDNVKSGESNEENASNDEANAKESEMEIEGIVQGEADNNVVQSAGQITNGDNDGNHNSVKVHSMIEEHDMEQLAAMVLNGDGQYLIGAKSTQPEIQAFLDNVPAYMNKIRRVHIAAREGNLRDLQSALDRRKFAIAKDDVSPAKCTPIHVATVFGHASILRYLGGRFPETTSVVDENGRTALHYAATIKDNGHFFNLLIHLGANPKSIDKFGHTTEFYLEHEKSDQILSHADLLKSFGVTEPIADDMLNDQERKRVEQQSGTPLFQTEEGRYLAATLGDSLIKGLTQVANTRPTNPVKFLADYLHSIADTKRTQEVPKNLNEIIEPIKQENQIKEPEQGQEQLLKQSSPESEQKQPRKNMNMFGFDETDEDISMSNASESAPTSDERDEHGQSVLHFACARSHGRNALIQLIEDSGISIGYRDELYRTARDVSMQATQPENTRDIDKYVLSLAARGKIDAIKHLVVEGYDHIADVHDDDTITRVAYSRGHNELAKYIESISNFEANREKLHQAVRAADLNEVKRMIELPDGNLYAVAKNYYGRTALHIAILKGHEEIVEYLSKTIKRTIHIGDNLERTALHYAMGVANVENLSRILIKNGAKRVLKDLKGRQPSYYFINRSDIIRLQEEEEEEDEL